MNASNARKTTADDTVSAFDAVAITESDTAVIASTRALWIGGTGNLVVTMNSGRSATFNNVPAGTLLPIQVTQLLAASTVTDVVAMY